VNGPPGCTLCGAGDTRTVAHGRDRLLRVAGEFSVRACRHCGLGETAPRLDDDSLRPYYAADYSPHGTVSGPAGLREARARAKLRLGPFRELLDIPPGRALDVGCGGGRLGEWLTVRGWNVTGVEPSPRAAAAARARGLTVHAESFANVELEPASFDAVLFDHSLEHLPDPLAALAKARALLRPRGVFLATVPDFGSWQRRLFGTYWFHLDLPRHVTHFEARTLVRALSEGDFRDVQTRSSVTSVGFWASLQYVVAGRCVLTGRARAVGLVLADLAYPLLLLTRLFGGDVIVVTARR
jgi:SAM-dependent methyltransferase